MVLIRQRAAGVHHFSSVMRGSDCRNWPSRLHKCNATIIDDNKPCCAQELKDHDDRLLHGGRARRGGCPCHKQRLLSLAITLHNAGPYYSQLEYRV